MPIRTCEHCGKPVRFAPSQAGRKRFCSIDCRNAGVGAANVKTYQRTCKVCGVAFTITGSAQRRSKTCSPECANAAKALRDPSQSVRIEKHCEYCGKTFSVFPSRIGRYCSRACNRADTTRRNTGQVRTSKELPCLYCGKLIRRFACRAKEYQRQFCNNDCYHAWDSLYKSSPDMLRRLSERLRNGLGQPSKIEDRIATWLDEHHLSYERQATLKVYSMDFRVSNAYIEVQGCYWHGCSDCFILQTPRQRKTIARDKAKATYCRKRDIPLYIIWEHDIQRNDFSALIPLLG